MSTTDRPVVAIPCDVKAAGIHPFHAVGEKYINAIFHGSNCLPVLLPAFGGGEDLKPLNGDIDPRRLLSGFDAIFLPGSTSNVDPAIYGQDLVFAPEYLDKQRDATTFDLIRTAITEAVPLFAICRGLQELNVAYGGTLHQKVHEVPGLMDHREDQTLPRAQQYDPAHPVSLVEGGLLAGLAGCDTLEVNSLHGQGIAELGDGLTVEATSPDGLIEGIRVSDAPGLALAVQWHAEWRYWEDPLSAALFRAFGDAARERAAAR